MTKVRIPVRVGTDGVPTRVSDSDPGSVDARPAQGAEAAPGASPATTGPGSQETSIGEPAYRSSEENLWRDRALRLQAEMDNYRKRQQRLAEERARAEQERLLYDVLDVADNLERCLDAVQGSLDAVQGSLDAARDSRDASPEGDASLRKGVELTRDGLMRVLRKHGVERFEARGEPFDPARHEAVHVVPARTLGVEAGTVVEVVRPGYRRKADRPSGERLFRPARVVVAN